MGTITIDGRKVEFTDEKNLLTIIRKAGIDIPTPVSYTHLLCHDIGEKLKCHGCMESLLRTRVGQFLLKDSLTLAQVETYRDENRITEIVMPVDQVFSDCPALELTKEAAKLGYNGNPFTSTQALTENDQMVEKSSDISLDGGKWFRVYDPEGVFIGVYAYDSKRDRCV